MSRRKKLYEGKAKIIYEGPEPNTYIQYFKDDATAFNAEKRGTIAGKGVVNNAITELIFSRLSDIRIPNHFIKRLNMREQLIKSVDIVQVEVIVRNITTGSLCKKFGVEEGIELDRPIVELCYKSDEHGDPIIGEDHAISLGWATQEELDVMIDYTLRINDFLSGLFAAVNLRLVDFKLEFGRYTDDDQEYIILADEITPDTCRLWDYDTNEKLDKDRFRQDLGGEAEAYHEVARRLGVLPKNLDEGDGSEADNVQAIR